MHTGAAIPRVRTDAPLAQALLEMTDKGFGMTTVVDEQDALVGVYTDGDLRRSVGQGVRLTDTAIGALMTPNPKTIGDNTLAAEGLKIMEDLKITALVVVNEHRQPLGILHMHDILRADII